MLTADSSAAFIKYRYNYIRNIQIIQTDCHRYNIYNGINCPDFMKMYLLHRHIMCLALCFCKNLKYSQSNLFCIVSHCTMFYNMRNFFHPSMFMVMVTMCSFSLMCTCMVCNNMFMCMNLRLSLSILIMTMQILHIMIMVFMIFI